MALATMIVAPAQETYAAIIATTSPMMQMDDGAPCAQQNCAKVPNCPLAVTCLSVSAVDAALSAKSAFQPIVRIVRFAFSVQPEFSSVDGGGLRRPPKA